MYLSVHGHFTPEAARQALHALTSANELEWPRGLLEGVLTQQLDALGLLAESAPDLAHALTEEWSRDERRALTDAAHQAIQARLDAVDTRLRSAEARRDLLQTLPVLSAEPQEAARLQDGVEEAVWAREGVHRLGFALVALDPSHDGAAQNDSLERLDERLRALLPALSRLAVARSVAAAGLPAEIRDAHWWFTLPADDDLDDAPLSADEVPELKAISRFLAERVEWTERGPMIRLSAEEHRRLAASEAGLAFLDAHPDIIDVGSDPLPEPAPVPSLWERLGDGLRAIVDAVWTKAPSSLSPAHAFAASGEVIIPDGRLAQVVWVTSARLDPSVGVVADAVLDRPNPAGGRWTDRCVWILPCASVVAVGVDSPETCVAANSAAPNGLAWLVESEGATTLRLWTQTEGESEPDALEYHFGALAPGGPDIANQDADLWTTLLRTAVARGCDNARALWAEVVGGISEVDRVAASGLMAFLGLPAGESAR